MLFRRPLPEYHLSSRKKEKKRKPKKFSAFINKKRTDVTRAFGAVREVLFKTSNFLKRKINKVYF